MSTIKELAETCGVSEQAIRKWCARNQVSKDIAKHYIIDRATAAARCWRKAAQGKIRYKPQQLLFVQKETGGKTIDII